MTDTDLDRLMRSVGLSVFVEYFELFADSTLSNADVADRLPHEYKLTARQTRVSCARRIIDRGLAPEALRIISESTRVDSHTSERAAAILRGL